ALRRAADCDGVLRQSKSLRRVAGQTNQSRRRDIVGCRLVRAGASRARGFGRRNVCGASLGGGGALLQLLLQRRDPRVASLEGSILVRDRLLEVSDVRAGIVELFTQLTKLARCRTQLLLAIVELNELCGDLLALVFDFRLELRD